MIREKYFAKGQTCPVLISCGQDPRSPHEQRRSATASASTTIWRPARRRSTSSERAHRLPMPRARARARRRHVWRSHEARSRSANSWAITPAMRAAAHHKTGALLSPRSIIHTCPTVAAAMELYGRARRGEGGDDLDEIEKRASPACRRVEPQAASAVSQRISIKHVRGTRQPAAMLAAIANPAPMPAAGSSSSTKNRSSDIHAVIWAMCTRCDPPNDIDYIHGAWSTRSIRCCDPRLMKNNRPSVNACRPWGWKDEFPRQRSKSRSSEPGHDPLARIFRDISNYRKTSR